MIEEEEGKRFIGGRVETEEGEGGVRMTRRPGVGEKEGEGGGGLDVKKEEEVEFRLDDILEKAE